MNLLLNPVVTECAAIKTSEIKPHLIDMYTVLSNHSGYLQTIFNYTRGMALAIDTLQRQSNQVADDVNRLDEIAANIATRQLEYSAQDDQLEARLRAIENNLTTIHHTQVESHQNTTKSLDKLVQDSEPLSQNWIITFCVILLTVMVCILLSIVLLLVFSAASGSPARRWRPCGLRGRRSDRD